MQKHLRILAFGLLTSGIAAPLAAQDADAPSPDTVVATVNGTEITLGHMIAARGTLSDHFSQLDPQELYNGILNQLVEQTALAQLTENLPRRMAVVLENEERSLKATQTILRETKDAVTEADIQAAYDARYGSLDPQEEFHASHILVETLEEAEAIKAELEAGADFAATAREESTGPSGPNGGELGWFGTGMMVPDFEAATIALEVGEISEPVQTQFGWHVIRLNDTRKVEIPELEQVRPQIVDALRKAAAQAVIDRSTDGVDLVIPELEGLDPAILTQNELLDQ